MPLHLLAYILKQDDLHLDYKSATLKIYYKTGEVKYSTNRRYTRHRGLLISLS